MRLKRRIEERGRVLEFLSAFRRPVGEGHLLKTEEDYIEYFKTILYIKKHIDSQNIKLERERIWYTLWRSTLVSFIVILPLFIVSYLCGIVVALGWLAYVAIGIGFVWLVMGAYLFHYKSKANEAIPPFTIYDCTKMYNGYTNHRRSSNILAECYVLKSLYSKERDKYELHLITYADVKAYMLLADAMLVATSKTYSVGSNEMIDHRKGNHSDILRKYYRESHYVDHWRDDAYIPSEIYDLLNDKYRIPQ